MTPKLPVISGKDLIKFLERLGYTVVSQRGSHVKLVLLRDRQEHTIIVPMHREIAKGTLHDILSAVSKHTGLEKQALRQMLIRF